MQANDRRPDQYTGCAGQPPAADRHECDKEDRAHYSAGAIALCVGLNILVIVLALVVLAVRFVWRLSGA